MNPIVRLSQPKSPLEPAVPSISEAQAKEMMWMMSRSGGFGDFTKHAETRGALIRKDMSGNLVKKWRQIDPDEVEHLRGFGAEVERREGGRWYTTAMADSPRYMSHGNSMSVPVIRWIGRRIEIVRARHTKQEVA